MFSPLGYYWPPVRWGINTLVCCVKLGGSSTCTCTVLTRRPWVTRQARLHAQPTCISGRVSGYMSRSFFPRVVGPTSQLDSSP